MSSQLKLPLDPTPYPRDPRTRPAAANLPDGGYVYVQDAAGLIYVLPDGPHLHPKILGGGQAVLFAGDVTIEKGVVRDVTNLSGTFQCDEPEGLRAVAEQFVRQGLSLSPGAVRYFPADGSRPVVLQ